MLFRSKHPDLEGDLTFTVLYHAPPQTSDTNDEVLERVAAAGYDGMDLALEWMKKSGTDQARQEIRGACWRLETENSHLLMYPPQRGDQRIADLQSMINRKAIEVLGTAYSIAEGAALAPQE